MHLFNRQEERKSIIINFIRLLFGALIGFELLNLVGILHLGLEYTWLGLVATLTISLSLLEVIAYKYKRKKGFRLHWSIWLVVLLALCLDAFGDFFHFYGKFSWWDQTAHLFISAVVCFTLFIVINAFWVDKFKFILLFTKGRLKLSLLLAAATTMSLSALYEIEEYLEDLIFQTNRLGPGTDTANDLFFNLLGVLLAVIFVVIYYLLTHKREIFK